MIKSTNTFTMFCDLNQVEKQEKSGPASLLRKLKRFGSVYEVKVDVTHQDIVDGEIVNHPTMHCKIDSALTLAEISERFNPDLFVFNQIKSTENLEISNQRYHDYESNSRYLGGQLGLINFQIQRSTNWQNLQARASTEYLNLLSKEVLKKLKTNSMTALKPSLSSAGEDIDKLYEASGRNVEIWCSGESIEVENVIANSLPPILHRISEFLIENSLESEQERTILGKPNPIQLNLKAAIFGDQIELSISDDGKGANEEEIAKLIQCLKPKLESMNGKVSVHTSPDNGISIKLLIHETLCQIPCDVTSWEGQNFAIPLLHLKEAGQINKTNHDSKIKIVGQHFYYAKGDQLVPAIFFEDILDYNSRFTSEIYQSIFEKRKAQDPDNYKVYEYELGSKHFALLVPGKTKEELLTVSQKSCPPLIILSGKGFSKGGKCSLILDIFSIGEHTLAIKTADSSEKVVAAA